MSGTLDRSFRIAKLSLGVVWQDKEMLAFPALGGLFSAVYAFVVMWPTVISHFMDPAGESFAWGAVQNVAAFATYFGLAFIATFFNVCTVYTTKTRFAGGDATFGQSIRFALSRLHLILSWSLVAASVGMLFRALDQLAERLGGIGGLLLDVLGGLLGMAWSVLTLFVVPVMVYEEVGPMDAIKRSSEVLKRTWGESLVRHFGLGIAQFLCMLPGIALIVLAFSAQSFALGLVGVAWIALTALVFSVASVVFNTALYEYAQSGQVPGGFDSGTLESAFVPRASR